MLSILNTYTIHTPLFASQIDNYILVESRQCIVKNDHVIIVPRFPPVFKTFESLLHIVPFCEGPNKKSEGFAKEKQKT